jgi:hypothetical protein
VVRTFGQGDFQFNNFGELQSDHSRAFPGGAANALMTPGGGYVAVEYVFISLPASPSVSLVGLLDALERLPGQHHSSLLGGNNTDTGVNNIQYTAEFGNGVSASIGLDDPTVWNRTAVYNLSSPPGDRRQRHRIERLCRHPFSRRRRQNPGRSGLGSIPAVGGRARGQRVLQHAGRGRRADQSSRKSAATPETKWGGSVMAALQIKNIPTGAGDDIKFDVSYAKGTTKNVIATSGDSPNFAMFGGSSSAYQSVGFGATTDGVYLPGAAGTGGIVLTTAWGLRGAFNHNWDPYWSSSLFGCYSQVKL